MSYLKGVHNLIHWRVVFMCLLYAWDYKYIAGHMKKYFNISSGYLAPDEIIAV